MEAAEVILHPFCIMKNSKKRIQDWLEKWAKCRQVKDAALAVFGEGKEGLLSSSQSGLFQFARRQGLSIVFDEYNVIAAGKSITELYVCLCVFELLNQNEGILWMPQQKLIPLYR